MSKIAVGEISTSAYKLSSSKTTYSFSITHNYGKIPTNYIIYPNNIPYTSGTLEGVVYYLYMIKNDSLYHLVAKGASTSSSSIRGIIINSGSSIISSSDWNGTITKSSTQFIFTFSGTKYYSSPNFYNWIQPGDSLSYIIYE